MKTTSSVAVLLVMILTSVQTWAQTNVCITFDEPNTISQWESYNVQNVSVIYLDSTHGNVLQFTDDQGGSIVFNEGVKEGGLAGNWTGLYPCPDTLYFCFDYKVKWTGNSAAIPNSPKIWLYSGGPITSLADFNSREKAFFVPNTTTPPVQADMENDVWRRFCFPIIMCSNGSLPPANQSGHWVVSVNSSDPVPDQCSAWNSIIQNISGVAFPSDYNGVPDEVVSVDNICWECEITPCDTAYPAIRLDTACCTFTVPMTVAYDDLASIDYTVIGGLMSSISVNSGCTATWTPTTSNTGTLNFPPPFCDANNISVFVDLLPLATPVSIAWTYHHMTGQICYDTTTVICHVEVDARCDVIRTAPIIDNTFPGRGKSVTIQNTKYPESPICNVRISMSPDPLPSEPNNKWLGGLYVNVTQPSQTQSAIMWPLTQSGNPFYSLIHFGTSSMGPVVATNGLIEFQIGVNYTINYQGSVAVVVEHCDGTVCDTTFPLCALQPAIACIPELASAPELQSAKLGLKGELLGGVIGINAQISKMMNGDFSRGRDVRGVHITVVSPDAAEPPKIFALGGDNLGSSITGVQASLPSRVRIRSASIRDNEGLLTLSRGLTDKDTLPVPIVVLTQSSSNKVNVIYTLMLDNGDPLLSDTVLLDLTVSSVDIGGMQGIQPTLDGPQPMPASQDVTIRFWLPEGSPCTIRLFDALGRPVRTILSQDLSSGNHVQEFSVRDLPSGLYFVNLLTPSASISTKLNVIR